MRRGSWWLTGFAMVTGALAAADQPAATSSAPATQPAATSVPASMPTTAYVDPAFGFEMQLPTGWDYDRSRFQQFADAIGLLRGRGPGGRQGLQIQIFRIPPRDASRVEKDKGGVSYPDFEDWVVEFAKALAEDASADRVEWESWKLPPRVGVLLWYRTKIGALVTKTFTLCVPFDPATVWVLVYSGAVAEDADEERLRREFEQVAGSLRVHYDPLAVEHLGEALERGRKLIERVHKAGADVRLDQGEQWYDIAIAGKSIGYLRRQVSREEHVFSSPGARHTDARDGLRLRERSWRFAPDGTVRHTRLDMFSSFDGQNELIENVQTQFPAPDVQGQPPLARTDQVVRKEDVLFAGSRTSLDRELPDPGKPLSVGPVYLDLAWVRLAPGLLAGAPHEPHAFVTFDTETRALLSHLITPLGERRIEGSKDPVLAFEVREGLIDRPTLLYTDSRGTMVRLVAGDLVVQRITADEVERRYGAKRDDAKRRFQFEEQ